MKSYLSLPVERTDLWTDRNGDPITWTARDGCLTVNRGDILTKDCYRDAHIHLEFRVPYMPNCQGQAKGNSGVYLHGCYELQILDSIHVESPADDDCGAFYHMYAPRVNACNRAMVWQSYDIYFRAPRFENGTLRDYARATVFQNGVCIHNNVELHPTPGALFAEPPEKGPLLLQEHGDPVSFRNIWIEMY